ncbi:MAG: hypothetical protein ACJ786_33590, partial [Catenulispora sp.]
GIVAALLVPTHLPARTPEVAVHAEPAPSPAGREPGRPAPNPVRTFCDPAGPPIHPRERTGSP